MHSLDLASARMVCIGFDGTAVTPELRQLIGRGVSSVILFTRNYESPAQLAGLCAQIKSIANRPIMICIDQEGGRVQRLREPFTIFPSMRTIGQTGDVEQARSIGRVLAEELQSVNIDMNLAPVLDVDSNPANPVIGERSFGGDPNLVAAMGCALIDGLQSSGLVACGKHFPGHGDTHIDSHLDLPRVAHNLDRLWQIELPPFAAAIKAGVSAIMTSHVLFDALDAENPATMSPAVIDQLLRQRLGFEGVIISDDLEMKAIADHFGFEDAIIGAARAGVDLLMVCHSSELQNRAIEALMQAVRDGVLSGSAVDQANRRLDGLFDRFVRPAHAAQHPFSRPSRGDCRG